MPRCREGDGCESATWGLFGCRARKYVDWEVPEMDHKRPIHYDMVEGKLFVFTTVEDRVWIRTELLTTVLKGKDQLGTIVDFHC